MISLKASIERNREELLGVALESYRSALGAMGESGLQACPPVGSALRDSLLNLQRALASHVSAESLRQSGETARVELEQWGAGAAGYFRQRAGEVKELMVILARTAELVGERDQRYVRRFQEFTGRLEGIADLHDLAQVRDSLIRSATDLRSCAEAMAEESRKSVAELRQNVNQCQARLDDAEKLAAADPLTGLDNRRRVEASIRLRLERGRPFCLLVVDLNGFKRINDEHGHLAGDDLLKQFAAELKSAFRNTDVVGRWGGDEFVVLADGGEGEAAAHEERVRKWVFGTYPIQTPRGPLKVHVDAAIGAASCRTGDSLESLVERADVEMYRNKRAAKSKT